MHYLHFYFLFPLCVCSACSCLSSLPLGGIVVFVRFLLVSTLIPSGLSVKLPLTTVVRGRLMIFVVLCWLQLSDLFAFGCQHQVDGWNLMEHP